MMAVVVVVVVVVVLLDVRRRCVRVMGGWRKQTTCVRLFVCWLVALAKVRVYTTVCVSLLLLSRRKKPGGVCNERGKHERISEIHGVLNYMYSRNSDSIAPSVSIRPYTSTSCRCVLLVFFIRTNYYGGPY